MLAYIKETLIQLASEGRIHPGSTMTLHTKAVVRSVNKNGDGSYSVNFDIVDDAEGNQP